MVYTCTSFSLIICRKCCRGHGWEFARPCDLRAIWEVTLTLSVTALQNTALQPNPNQLACLVSCGSEVATVVQFGVEGNFIFLPHVLCQLTCGVSKIIDSNLSILVENQAGQEGRLGSTLSCQGWSHLLPGPIHQVLHPPSTLFIHPCLPPLTGVNSLGPLLDPVLGGWCTSLRWPI